MAEEKIRGNKTGRAERLSFCQVLLRPVHNKETERQVERDDGEASMIYCLQLPTPLAVDISKKPKYNTPSARRYCANANDVICISLA